MGGLTNATLVAVYRPLTVVRGVNIRGDTTRHTHCNPLSA